MRVFTIVMAGGSGTRFWPLSRAGRPKQLLPLVGDRPMLAETLDRTRALGEASDTFIVTAEHLVDATQAAVPYIPAANILAEPVGRNTAPCIGWALTRIARIDPEGICMVLPADHHIGQLEAYQNTLRRALKAAEEDRLVTIGIKPSRAETGYGYIEIGDELSAQVHRARRFVEKPNPQRAQQFLTAGNFLWNSGMFFFRASTMLDAIRTHLPGLGEKLDQFAALPLADEMEAVRTEFATLPSVSIDHGVMEKVASVAVVPGEFGWSDLGSFASAWELAPKDAENNRLSAGAITLDACGTYIDAPAHKRVALIGVDDLIVVDTEDALLIMPRERAQDVKQIVQQLRKDNDPTIL